MLLDNREKSRLASALMEAALHVEQSIRRVVGAVQRTNKATVASKAGVAESNLRDCGEPGWRPNTATLEKLERAAIEIEREESERCEPSEEIPEQELRTGT